jgi:hypothetical protein
MRHPAAVPHADAAGAETARVGDQRAQHAAMRPEQIASQRRGEARGLGVDGDGVLHLDDVAPRARHASPVEDGRDLRGREGVALDGQTALDRPDAVLAPQLWFRPRAEQTLRGRPAAAMLAIVDAESIRAFARRDRTSVDALKRAHHAARFREHGAAPGVALARALWVHARRVRPDWPTARDRAEDLAHHVGVKARLDRAAHAVSRR